MSGAGRWFRWWAGQGSWRAQSGEQSPGGGSCIVWIRRAKRQFSTILRFHTRSMSGMRGRRRGRHRLGSLTRWGRGTGDAAVAVPTGRARPGLEKTSFLRGNSGLRIVLWDTRHGGAYKDFAGGFGVGQFRGQGFRAKIIEHFYRRDFRAPPLSYGYLAAGLTQSGHSVEYCLEET